MLTSRTGQDAHLPQFHVGTAGWSIPASMAHHFPRSGSHLERYGQVLNAVEINSSFYRTHMPKTYERWAASVPQAFRFSIKIPRSISHEARLAGCDDLLECFLSGVERLGDKLGCLLLQLPPSLGWDAHVALPFLEQLRRLYSGPVVCEPRHASWFQLEATRALASFHVSRVAADPALCVRARVPAGDRQLQYVRLHGSPRMYYDAYNEAALTSLAQRMQRPSTDTSDRWCIFDNTAGGHALANAVGLLTRLDLTTHVA